MVLLDASMRKLDKRLISAALLSSVFHASLLALSMFGSRALPERAAARRAHDVSLGSSGGGTPLSGARNRTRLDRRSSEQGEKIEQNEKRDAGSQPEARSAPSGREAGQPPEAGSGPPGPGPAGAATVREDYVAELMTWIDAHKRYPAVSKRLGEQGEAEVEFTLLKDGTLSGARLVRSAGHARLDEAALALISNLERFKPIPEELNIQEWKLVLPIAFGLNP